MRRGAAVALALSLLVPLLVPAGALATVGTARGGASPTAAPPTNPGGSGIGYSFTWNGKSVTGASTASSALAVTLSSPIAMQFHWSGPGPQGPPGGVSEVEFQAFLFGFPFITRALTNSPALTTPAGVSNLTWDPGALNFLIAGAYQCLASIFAPNGTTTWSEWFYVHIQAPYTVGAVLPIILLLLVLFEVYALLTVKPTPPKGVKPASPAAPASDSSAPPEEPSADAESSPAGSTGGGSGKV